MPGTRTGAVADPTRRSVQSASLTLVVACVGLVVTVLDSTAVTVALPTIGDQLGGAVSGLQWVVDAYALMFAGLMLSAGSISDRAGASRAFGVGVGLFTLASALCALAPSLALLIAARAVQGGAAAVMLPASLALVRQAYADPRARIRAIAYWTASGGVAIAAGPVVGGVLTDALGWQAIFLINVPIGLLGLVGLLQAPRSTPRQAPLDLIGQVAAMLAVTGATFAAIEGGAGSVLAGLVGAAVCVVGAILFVRVERRSPHPAVPLHLFRSVPVTVYVATGFALNFAFYGIVFVLTLFFQNQRGVTPMTAGLMFVPMTGFVMAANLLAGKLTTRFGPRPPMVAGQLVQAAGLLGLVSVSRATPTVVILVLLVPLGIGAGLAVPPLTTALLDAVDAERAGLASGLLNAARQLGGAVGVALSGALVGIGFVAGMRIALVGSAALLLATAAAGAARRTRS
ncbi:MFS transporter [Actinopolymorpha pittospori]|uniref:DHA2 family methylenomycin A resistance protein-like MFS transporter n=1 Tax=Actinopolymorpha pittospori TaxID=648752 RepID=A0A927RCC5_9ACTN|nr:MFS transporter [Actinopolymorpha pittospori]MBE1611117.1 DHA2 family methylenomycin A resistance protein-like MFS transporter [Actinopolymorpha pittospori]